MPPSYALLHLHARDGEAPDPNAAGPGQRVSIDGGIEDKRGILAMILAICLFIFVLILYQYLTVLVARREESEAEARKSGRQRHKRRQSHPDETTSIIDLMSELLMKCISHLKRLVSSTKRRPSFGSGSYSSTEALFKVKLRNPPQRRRTFPELPCIARRKEIKAKKADRQIPRPLLLNRDPRYQTYTPRSPIDGRTYELLRSPDAFAEYSDPVRNMNFVRMQGEVQRRKEQDEVWYEELIEGPGRPTVACVAPLAFRKKSKEVLLREGDTPNSEWVPPSPENIIFPVRQTAEPTTLPPSMRETKHSLPLPYHPQSPGSLGTTCEGREPPTPRSFFEDDDDDDDGTTKPRRRKFSLKFSLPSRSKTSPCKEVDVFSIGSFSESGDETGH